MDRDPVDRRERKKRANRDALRDAGLRLFVDKGFANTTLHDITDAADLGLRTFYRHFDTKEDLLLVEIRDYLDDLETILEACPADLGPIDCCYHALDQLRPRWQPLFDDSRGIAARLYAIGEREPSVIARFHWVVDQHVTRVMHIFARRLATDPETLEPRLLAYLSRIVLSVSLFLHSKGAEPGGLFDIAERVLTRLASGIDPKAAQRHHDRNT